MPNLFLRFYEELNDFLPADIRKRTFEHRFEGEKQVSDVLAEFRVPLEQVDLILLNGASADAGQRLRDNDRLSFYPVFESFDISSLQKLREKPLRTPKFVLDVHLGKLANHLRMLGFDTQYRNNFSDADLITLSHNEQRTLLSKDRVLIEESGITRGYLVKEKDPKLQLVEILDRFDLYSLINPFCRCIECNTVLIPIEKEQILHRLPPKVKELFSNFLYCKNCDRIYWQGSHFAHMSKFIDSVIAHRAPSPNSGELSGN